VFLYDVQGETRKYLWARDYEEHPKTHCSEVILAETFSTTIVGAICHVTMSNALVCRTETVDSSSGTTNSIRQLRAYSDVLALKLPAKTKVVFDNSTTTLGDVRLNFKVNTNTVTFEGEAAIKELKRRGLAPPPDMRR
jgi:hypothetical protein